MYENTRNISTPRGGNITPIDRTRREMPSGISGLVVGAAVPANIPKPTINPNAVVRLGKK